MSERDWRQPNVGLTECDLQSEDRIMVVKALTASERRDSSGWYVEPKIKVGIAGTAVVPVTKVLQTCK